MDLRIWREGTPSPPPPYCGTPWLQECAFFSWNQVLNPHVMLHIQSFLHPGYDAMELEFNGLAFWATNSWEKQDHLTPHSLYDHHHHHQP